MLDTTSLNALAKSIHQDNVERGFYDKPREVGTTLMLVVSELAEAIEADRKNRHADLEAFKMAKTELTFKAFMKDTFEDEIADAFIRLFDLVGLYDIDIEQHIDAKLAFNRTRGYKHGKEY